VSAVNMKYPEYAFTAQYHNVTLISSHSVI